MYGLCYCTKRWRLLQTQGEVGEVEAEEVEAEEGEGKVEGMVYKT